MKSRVIKSPVLWNILDFLLSRRAILINIRVVSRETSARSGAWETLKTLKSDYLTALTRNFGQLTERACLRREFLRRGHLNSNEGRQRLSSAENLCALIVFFGHSVPWWSAFCDSVPREHLQTLTCNPPTRALIDVGCTNVTIGCRGTVVDIPQRYAKIFKFAFK